MINLIKRDMILLFANWKTAIGYFIFMPFLLFFIGIDGANEMVIFSIVVLGYFFTILSFSYDYRNSTYLLIQSLPISRKEVVISKYISTFINLLISSVYTLAYMWIINLFKNLNVDMINITFIKEAFLIVMLGLSISLFGFFVFNPKGARILSTIIYILGLNFFILQPETTFRRYEISNKLGVIIIVLYIISLGLSIWIYERKDLV